MLFRPSVRRRRGSVLVESAVIYPVVFLLLLGLMVGGMGVFYYQQMAWLAREGARYASVRGAQYGRDQAAAKTGKTSITDADLQTYLRDMAVISDSENITVTTNWNTSREPTKVVGSDYENQVSNTVEVTVQYTWSPGFFFGGSYTMQSKSVMPISY